MPEQIKAVEEELGVSIGKPKDPFLCPNQQFGVSDEDGVFAGDVMARGQDFTQDELRESIEQLFKRIKK